MCGYLVAMVLSGLPREGGVDRDVVPISLPTAATASRLQSRLQSTFVTLGFHAHQHGGIACQTHSKDLGQDLAATVREISCRLLPF